MGGPGGAVFTDVSAFAGIYGSVIGFGLGVTVGDVNLDGYPDLYVSNDFHERDYFYLNNRDGTFKEQLPAYFDQISLSSMGADLADLNNDGLPEIFSTDMLPRDDRRLKLNTTFQNYDIYKKRQQLDYYNQFTSNMLHLHSGLSAGGELLPYAEVGELAGVEATDWSWGALMADFDNDSRRDILVCNGIYKDVTNQDFLNFLSSDKNLDAAMRGEKINFKQWIDKIPSEKIPNCLFTRDSSAGLRFTNVAAEWGLGEPSFSNGAAYGDLDNDGDLDLVVNNVNQESFVYRNETAGPGGPPALRVHFQGEELNTFGVGALLYLFRGNEILTYEHYPMRGFQSSMDYTAVIGLGSGGPIDSGIVWWPGGKRQKISTFPTGADLTLRAADAAPGPGPDYAHRLAKGLMRDVTAASGLRFNHVENPYSDFDREQMLYTMRSTDGPALAVGDLNGDGLEDLFIGGAKDQAGALFLQKPDGSFAAATQPALGADQAAEDVAAAFFDVDGDGDQDLYVAGGGSEFYDNTALLQGRLYLNEKGRLIKAPDRLPVLNNNGSCVRPFDYDGDGDQDLFLGSRSVPGYYGQAPDSYLLENDGQGRFSDVTRLKARELRKLGLVTDAVWSDADGDGRTDLIVVGEWMTPTVFKNDGGRLVKSGPLGGLEKTRGWWTRIAPADLDGDGDTDFVLGNIGENSRFQASPDDPLTLYAGDFDRNGTLDQIFSYRQDGKNYPMNMLHDLVKRLPFLKKRMLLYSEYAGKTMEEIFKPEELQEATKLEAHTLATTLYINEGGGRYTNRPLPDAAQVAPVYGIAVDDFDGDGKTDLLLTGNFFATKPELGRLAGNYGLLLTGDGKNGFRPQTQGRTGVFSREQVRQATVLKPVQGRQRVVLAQNNASLLMWEY